MSTPRVLPHSTEAEFHLIGGLLLDNESFSDVGDLLDPSEFYHESHRILFEVIRDLLQSKSTADPVSLFDRLKDSGQLEQIGGPALLAELVDKVPTAANARTHALIIKEKACLRRLIRTCGDVMDEAYADVPDVGEFVDVSEQKVFDVREASQQNLRTGPEPIRPLLQSTLERLRARRASPDDVTGVASGFRDLDLMTAGFQDGELVILAARPSMGKTSLGLNIAANVVEGSEGRPGVCVAVFSLEMGSDQLVSRMLASSARVPSERMRTGRLTTAEMVRIGQSVEKFSETSLFIDDEPAQTPLQIRSKCRRLKKKHNLGLVVIDYLQLMRAVDTTSGRRFDSREREISEISRALKALAKDLKIPVLALAQLNRDVEKRQNKRPQLSDLRESGAIEQDADVIMFIHRERFKPENDEESQSASSTSETEIIIGKQRNGPIGSLKLLFWERYTKFDNFSQDERAAQAY